MCGLCLRVARCSILFAMTCSRNSLDHASSVPCRRGPRSLVLRAAVELFRTAPPASARVRRLPWSACRRCCCEPIQLSPVPHLGGRACKAAPSRCGCTVRARGTFLGFVCCTTAACCELSCPARSAPLPSVSAPALARHSLAQRRAVGRRGSQCPAGSVAGSTSRSNATSRRASVFDPARSTPDQLALRR